MEFQHLPDGCLNYLVLLSFASLFVKKKKKDNKPIVLGQWASYEKVERCSQWGSQRVGIHEDVGSIPDLAQWVKDLALS